MWSNVRGWLWMLGLVSLTTPAVAQESTKPAKQQAQRPIYVVYAAEEDAEVASSLRRVLRDTKGKPTRIGKADSIRAASESAADVAMLVMTKLNKVPAIDKDVLAALKKHKIVGIGTGAAQVFGQLGLEINRGALMHGMTPPATLKITNSTLLGKPVVQKPIPLFIDTPDAIELGAREVEFCAMFAHPRGKDAAVVDVIARWNEDANYAPIVRQGNCILIGIPASATVWSAPYSELIRNTCLALHKRPLEPFAAARRDLSKPGTYEFQLAKRNSTDEPFDKTLFFRFSEPAKLTARLEHSGSDSMCLFFTGDDFQFTHNMRKDSKNGDPLEISVDITREDIETLGDRYWYVSVFNFDADGRADCKLTIAVAQP